MNFERLFLAVGDDGAMNIDTGSTMSAEEATELAEAVKISNIQSLNLCNYSVDDNGIVLLCDGLSKNESLTHLSLKRNNIGDIAAESLAYRVLRGNRTLVRLDLSFNQITDIGVLDLATSLEANHTLLELVLTYNNIGYMGAQYLSRALKHNNSLTELNLGYNVIDHHGCKYLMNALKVNSTLIGLNLSCNQIGDVGTKLLCSGLSKNQSLAELKIDLNHIGQTGAQHLSSMLKHNSRLAILNLAGNRLGDKGAKWIAEGIKANTSLLSLTLADNNIGDMGAGYIASSLKINRGLINLSLASNNIADEGGSRLANALEINKNLVVLRLPGNDIYERTKEDITTDLNENHFQKGRIYNNILRGSERAPWNAVKVMVLGSKHSGKTATVRSLLSLPYTPDVSAGETVSYGESRHNRPSWMIKSAKKRKDQASAFAAGLLLKKLSSSQTRRPDTLMMPRHGILAAMGDQAESYIHSELRATIQNVAGRANDFDGNVSRNASAFSRISDALPHTLRPFDENMILEAHLERDSSTFVIWDCDLDFTSIQHSFLTKSGIYVLTFDLRNMIKADASPNPLARLSFLLRSLKSLNPATTLILAGTFSNAIINRESLSFINSVLKGLLGETGITVTRNLEDGLLFFPIDNLSGQGIKELQQIVEKVHSTSPARHTLIPMQWIHFLDRMSLLGEHRPFISMSEVKELAQGVGISTTKEIEDVLTTFHERGVLLRLSTTEETKKLVILKPEWLVESISTIMKGGDEYYFNKKEIAKFGLQEDMRMTFQHAVASRDFLEYVWKENTQFFIDVMSTSMLLSEWNYRGDRHFLIPSALQGALLEDEEASGIRCVFDFSAAFLPPGVFQRLLCLLMTYKQMHSPADSVNSKPNLYSNFGSIEIDPGCVVHLHEDIGSSTITAHFENLEYAPTGLAVIRSKIEKMNLDVMFKSLKWDVYVETLVGSGFFVKLEKLKSRRAKTCWYSTKQSKQVINIDSFVENF